MTSPAWNEGLPAAGVTAESIDNRIRENNAALQDALEQDHNFTGTEESTQTGKHLQITFKAPLGAKPTLLASEGGLYTKDVNAKAELFWEDEDGDELQLTAGGLFAVANNTYLTSMDNAGTGQVDIIKVFTDDTIHIGTSTTVNGTLDVTGTTTVVALTASGVITGTNAALTTPTLTTPTMTDPVIDGGVSGSAIDTDGTMASPSNTVVPSQQAVVTYVGASVTLQASADSDTSPYGTLVLDGDEDPMGTSWGSSIDLDAVASIGQQKTLVMLKVVNNEASARAGHFRPTGCTEDVGYTGGYSSANGCTEWRCTSGECAFVIVLTSALGVIDYECSTAGSDIDVFLVGYFA